MTAPHRLGPLSLSDRMPVAALRFTLPPALILRAQAGRYGPLLHRLGLVVDEAGAVTIGAYDCDLASAMPALREQALRFLLTLHEARMAPASFAAELVVCSPLADAADQPIGSRQGNCWKEHYLIALGARVAMAQGARGMVVR